MSVNYSIASGPGACTCSGCVHYKPFPDNPKKGKCFSSEVECSGHCKFFRYKR